MNSEEVRDILQSLQGYKVRTDKGLMGMTKAYLIMCIRVVEHNWAVAEATLHQQYENTKYWEPVKHGHWIEKDEYISDVLVGTKQAYLKQTKLVCSLCGKKNKNYATPYCPHCGAKMDEEE